MILSRDRRYTCALLGTLAFIFGAPMIAGAQHGHGDMSVGSTADGGGQLFTEYDFERVLRTDFSAEVGPVALYGSTTPGIGAAEDEAPDIFELDVGTSVEMTLVDIADNLSIMIGASTLSASGDSANIGTHGGVTGDEGALHNHPTYQILLDAPKGEFGEGRFSFVFEDPNGLYGDSEIHTLHVTNGYLPPVEEPTNTTAKCQQQVGKEVGKLMSGTYKTLAACLDKIQGWKADGGDLEVDPVPASVAKVCADPAKGIVARTAASRAKALDKLADKCVGTFGADAEGATDALSPHLGMAECRVEEMIGAAYASALEDIAVVVFGDDEEAAADAFSCIGESQGDTVPHEE